MTTHAGPSSLLHRLYHWSASDTTIAEGDHEVLPSSTLPIIDTQVPPITPGDLLTMSDIVTLDEAPTAPEIVNDTSQDDFEDERGSVVQDAPGDVVDESWIPIPYVSNMNESILLLTYHTSHLVEQSVVEVKISGTHQSFFVEKDLLCNKSSYFKTALASRFMEANTGKFLLNERLDLFKIFYHWLKQGNLNFMDSADWAESVGDVLFAFVEIYSFADRRGVPALADLILCKLDRRVRPEGLPVRLAVDIIGAAWEQLPETSKLCRYVVAIERDANKCNLPKRAAVDYECLSGSFVAALLNATENSQWWTAAMVQKQRVDIAKVYNHIKSYGGLARVDRVRGWDEIMRQMGIRAPVGCDQDKLRGQFRAMSRRYLRPWDTTISRSRSEHTSAEEDCPRPLVRQFLHSAESVRVRVPIPVRTRQ